jgi:hypothetical protein
LLHATFLLGLSLALNWAQTSAPPADFTIESSDLSNLDWKPLLLRSNPADSLPTAARPILHDEAVGGGTTELANLVPAPPALPPALPPEQPDRPNPPPETPPAGTPAAQPPPVARNPFKISDQAALAAVSSRAPGPGPVAVGKIGGPVLGDIADRGKWRSDFALSHGGTPASEAAVERGLRWLKAHQRKDGAWHFNHNEGPCNGLCRDPGSAASTTASTGLALLAFFGAGYNQRDDSEFQETIQRGLYYLANRLLQTPHGGDLQEGTMYAQGIAAIALCEAYALTKEDVLKDYAKSAIKFILYAQDQHGGGWRYFPGEPGDTTVFGWQLMALKSAQMAGLDVPSPSFLLAQKYLDSVQTDGGAGYGYQSPSKGTETTTAVGLLSRIYLGWDRQRPGMAKGIEFLEKTGPSPDNMYYNYYAAQVLHHTDSHGWPRFNGLLREMLVKTQASEGHESGSWYFSGGHAVTGGRHYNTCLAILTLEIYYRYLPLFGEKAATSKF